MDTHTRVFSLNLALQKLGYMRYFNSETALSGVPCQWRASSQRCVELRIARRPVNPHNCGLFTIRQHCLFVRTPSTIKSLLLKDKAGAIEKKKKNWLLARENH